MSKEEKSIETPVTALALYEEFGAAATVPSDFDGYEGAGTSDDLKDTRVGFVRLLQDMSPHVKKREPEYIEGAEPGMFLFGNQLMTTFTFQPVFYERVYVEWTPRSQGGGLRGRHQELPKDAKEVPTKKEGITMLVRENGNELRETRYHYGHLLNMDGSFTPCVLSLSSTASGASKDLMTALTGLRVQRPADGKMVRPPSWFSGFRVRSVPKKNADGSWFGWAFDRLGYVTNKVLLDEGRQMYDKIAKGDMIVEEETGTAATDTSDTMPF